MQNQYESIFNKIKKYSINGIKKIYKPLLPGALLFFNTIAVFASAPYETNLLVNPDADTGDLSGWTITANSQLYGWRVQKSYIEPENNVFATSYGWDQREQVVDLLDLGFTADELDLSPPIQISEEFTRVACVDHFYLRVELLNNSRQVIGAYESGERVTRGKDACDTASVVKDYLSHVFSDYGKGVRYIRWKDGGTDTENLAGWFGVHLDNARLFIHSPQKMARNLIPEGETIQLAAANGQLLSCEADKVLANVARVERGCQITVEHTAGGSRLKTPNGYIFTNGDSLLSTANQQNAGLYGLILTTKGTLKILAKGEQQNWTMQDNLTDIHLASFDDFSRVDEFSVFFDRADQQSVAQFETLNSFDPCFIAETVFIWDITGGFLIAAGVGPYIADPDAGVKTGLINLIKSNQAASDAAKVLYEAILSNQAVTVGGVTTFMGVLYHEGLLWSALKFAMRTAGWYGATHALAKVIALVFAPELEVVELAASMTIWGAQTLLAGLEVGRACNVTMNSTEPSQQAPSPYN